MTHMIVPSGEVQIPWQRRPSSLEYEVFQTLWKSGCCLSCRYSKVLPVAFVTNYQIALSYKKTSKWPNEEIIFAPAGLTHLQIQESKHKLFFIEFTLVSTLRPLRYLIRIDLYSTLALQPATPPNGTYYCVILAKQPHNIHNSNQSRRWGLEWHKYSR